MLRLFACLSLFVVLLACSSSPTGRKQLILFSNSQMADLGQQSFAQIKQTSTLSSDKDALALVRCVSDAVLKAAGESPQQWEIQVFKDESANAFALPGNKIGVYTGMIVLINDPAQLAAVIGHEIGHVKAHHGAERMSMNALVQTGQQLTQLALNNTKNGQLAMAAIGLGAQLGILLPYSRTQESEADLIGLMLMAEAGFDPQQSIQLWQRMKQAGGQQPPEFLSTHPSNDSRIEHLSAAMASADSLYQHSQKSTCRMLATH